MATLVGTEDDASDTMNALVQLDLDVVELYDSVLPRVEDEQLRERLERSKQIHEKRADELASRLKDSGKSAGVGPATRQLNSPGSIIASDLVGEEAILKAVHASEQQVLNALERAAAALGNDSSAQSRFKAAIEETQQQSAWIAERLSQRK